MSERKNIPAFASESEEAASWYDNREAHDNAFAEAIENGRAHRSTLAQRLAEAKSIQLDAEDEARAIDLASGVGRSTGRL